MKEATGEVSMTVITLVAIGVIGAIIALFWPQIQSKISTLFGANDCPAGQYEDSNGNCVSPSLDSE